MSNHSQRKKQQLSQDEERLLLRQAQEGDCEALDQLVRGHMWLVLSIAKRSMRTTTTTAAFDLQDLVQEGSIGLLIAIHRFDLQQPVRFATYAYWWVRQAICRYLSKCRYTYSLEALLEESDQDLSLAVVDEGKADGFQPWTLAILNTLPAEQREAVKLRFEDDLSYAVIAAHLQTNSQRISRLLHRALEHLQQHLKAGD